MTRWAGFALAVLVSQAWAEAWQPVRGPSIQALFAGRELGDGVHFAYVFARDGTFRGTEMGKDVRGRWRVAGDGFCLAWTGPGAEEECYDVQRAGSEIRLLKNGSEAWSGRLTN